MINKDNDTYLLDKFKLAFRTAEEQSYLFNYGLTTSDTYRPQEIVQLIYFFLSVTESIYDDGIDSSSWVNGIYFLIPSNEKEIPLDKERCLTIIERVLPYGPSNPGAYWNSYCLYAAIGEIDKAFECLENTLIHKLNPRSLRNLIKELKIGDGEASILKADPRFEPFFKSFLEKAKPLLVED